MHNADLLDAILTLHTTFRTKEQCQEFFNDILTRKECTILKNRWGALCLLYEGQLTQREIAKQLGISLETVSRANHVLRYGTGAAIRIIERLQS